MPARPLYDHELEASQALRPRVDVVTTTLFTGPTAIGTGHTSSPIPIPAIVGGACAGMALAVFAVVGWQWWGRSIEKQQRKERQRRQAIQAAMAYRRAVTSKKSSSARKASRDRPIVPGHPSHDRKVTFVQHPGSLSDLSAEKTNGPPSTTSKSEYHPQTPSSPMPLKAYDLAKPMPRQAGQVLRGSANIRNYAPLRPSPLSHDRRQRAPAPASAPAPPMPRMPPTAHTYPTSSNSTNPAANFDANPAMVQELTHKASSISSTSHYSTQSGEERRPRKKSSLSSMLVQARRLSALTRSSGSSHSRYTTADEYPWRQSWRISYNAEQSDMSRLSGTSSLGNVEIGYAYGGEEDECLDAIAEHEQDDLEAGITVEYPREYFEYVQDMQGTNSLPLST